MVGLGENKEGPHGVNGVRPSPVPSRELPECPPAERPSLTRLFLRFRNPGKRPQFPDGDGARENWDRFVRRQGIKPPLREPASAWAYDARATVENVFDLRRRALKVFEAVCR